MSHTFWEDSEDAVTIRIISTRKATKQETQTYGEWTWERSMIFQKWERQVLSSRYEADIPIYLDEEVSPFVEKIASKKGVDRSSVVNELLRGDIRIAEAME